MFTISELRIYVVWFFLLILGVQPVSGQQRLDSTEIHFRFGGVEPTPADTIQLVNYLTKVFLADGTPRHIAVTGHTDSIGSVVYNSHLSQSRAMFIGRLLRRLLLKDSVKVDVYAVGESQPVHAIDSLNRMVEIRFLFVGRSSTLNVPSGLGRQIDTIFSLPLISFVEDRAIPTGQALMALPGYISLLKNYAEDSMVITGYYNFDGKTLQQNDPRYKLSTQRAKVIYDYLIASGFQENHLSYRGQGNSKMVIEHPLTENAMRKNIRVEITLYKPRRAE